MCLSCRLAAAHLELGRAVVTFPVRGRDEQPAVCVLGLRSWQSRLWTEHPDSGVRVRFLLWATVMARRAVLDDESRVM